MTTDPHRRQQTKTSRIRRSIARLATHIPGSALLLALPRLRRLESRYAHMSAQLADARAAMADANRARDEAHLLQREQARLWASSLSANNDSAGPLADFFRDGQFSYFLFDEGRERLTQAGDPYLLGPTTAARAQHEAGPVRFKALPPAGSPDAAVAFATVCTDKFAPGLEALILSLLAIYPNLESEFWVYHDESLSDFSQRRLLEYYPNFRFASRKSEPYTVAAKGASPNQRRIGAIGYLTLEALKLTSYNRVIILDSDLIVKRDISPLWTDSHLTDIRVVPDAGVLPFTTASKETGNVVFNSGVISLPHAALGEEQYQDALELLPQMPAVECPVLRGFADQKFWNIYLQRYRITYLPTNYNANKQLLDRYMPSRHADAAVVHYTNTKPWYSFASRDLVSSDERRRASRDSKQFRVSYSIWHSTYSQLAGARRRSMFTAQMGNVLDQLRDSARGKSAALIGNGPSLLKTNLAALDGRIRIAFNWFVNHPKFDEVAIEHLMIMSHMFFGGWHTTNPAFPDGFLEKLTSWSHRPTLWFPFYFRSLIEQTPELATYDVRYLLLEKPFKSFAEDLGYLSVDLYDHLTDAHTGVLTAGLPLAMHLGCHEVALVGCDASYGRSANMGDYFYPTAHHTSRSTTTASLHTAWADNGVGQYCYQLALKAAEERGVSFRDATLDGLLSVLPKQEIPGLRHVEG